jgi:SAM-dependent methyltransferase
MARTRAKTDPNRFDRAYYERFYGDPRTRVVDVADVRRLAEFVAAYLRWIGQPVARILDLGCGVGHWRTAATALWPKARYVGVEWSPYLCEAYGWTRGSVVDYANPTPFDLVVCQGVLQYLDDKQAAAAIANFTGLCRGALYVEALTKGDWTRNVDRARTDGDVHLRTAAWYRKRLGAAFTAIGGGLHLAPESPATLFELEHAETPR